MNEWKECTRMFSNGTEFECFMYQCESCTRYRNDNCRVLNACYMAMFDKSKFPYSDLEQNGIIRCKHYTEEPQVRHKRPFVGQISLFDSVKGGE